MDVYEATRSVFARIQAVDPANAAKIMGLLLIQDGGDKDMIRLAFGPEALLHSAVLRARRLLFGADLADDLLDRRSPRSAAAPFDLDPGFDRRGSDFCVEGSGFGGWRPCLYFAKGYCKNGSSCRFLHDLSDDLALPLSPLGTPKSMNFLLQHQNDPQRARMDFTGMMNPGSRQIYLTFPADSTFREDDVSNYFSIYGPVQDVRIPYQQKRMFGFVTFLYSETVKLILAKGNPHFVCDARVLVKPYKEKGKVPDKKQQQAERWDFSGCITPTGMDSRDPYEIGSRTLRRQMDELELQQAIELQGRQFMGLQLLDFKKRIVATANSDNNINSTTTSSSERSSPGKNRSPSPAAASTALPFSQTTESSSPHGLILVNGTAAHNEEPTGPREDTGFHECAEFNLPESPFASPTRPSSASAGTNAFPIESNLVATASALNISPFKSCFFQFPRFSSDHGAVGM